MILLAIDTSTATSALALGHGIGRDATTALGDPAQRHGRGLLAAIGDLLRRDGLTPKDLDVLAVGLGPGSYTGLRVGVTAAKVLAYALVRPLVGLDSLEAIARNAPPDALRISVAADAQRGDLYTADFGRDGIGLPMIRRGPTRIVPAATWAAGLLDGDFAIGPALDRPGLALPPGVRAADPHLNHPQGGTLAALAAELYEGGGRADPFFLEPTYLRRSAAEDQWDARSRLS